MKKIFGLIWYTIKFLLIYVIVTNVILMIPGIQLVMDRSITEERYQQLMFNYNMNLTPAIAITAFFIFYLLFKHKGKDLIKYCKFKKINWQQIILIVMVSLGISMITLYVVQIGMNFFPEYAGISDSYGGAMTSIFGVIGIILFAPFIEEVMVRGIIFNKYKENMNIYLAIFLQALLFGIMHGNSLQGIYTFVLAIVIAIVYIWTDSIIASILTHIFYNFFGSFLLTNILIIFQIDIIFVLAIGIIIFAVSMFYLRRITIKR